MNSVYKINKGINKPIEFKGLKAQYIAYLAAGLVALLIMVAILYVIGVNMFISAFITVVLGVLLFINIYKMSSQYGRHGLLKKMARRQIPDFIRGNSRTVFLNLKVSSSSKSSSQENHLQ